MAGERVTDSRKVDVEAGAPSPFSEIETQLALLARLSDGLSRRVVTYREMDRASYLIARVLEEAGPVSIQGLAGLLALEPTSVSRKVAHMEARGLIHRRTDPSDLRYSLIQLSPEGVRLMEDVREVRRAQAETALGHWSVEDQRNFGRLLRMYNESISRHLPNFMSRSPITRR